MPADQPIADGSYAQLHAEVTRLRADNAELYAVNTQLDAETERLREQLAAFAPPAGTAHPYCAFCNTAVDEHPGEPCSPGIVRDLRRELAAYRAAAQSTDLESAARDHLHGLADWDTPGGAAPDWLVDAVMGFVAPHVAERDQARAELAEAREVLSASRVVRRAGYTIVRRDGFARLRTRVEQAEAERDTAQAAITRAREHLAKLIELGQFTEKATVAEIVPLLHHLAAALNPPSAPESQEAARHIGGNANAEDCPACSGTNPPYPFICPGDDESTEETDHG